MVVSVRNLAILVIAALCTTFSVGNTAQRVVLFEECTSATCPPCRPANENEVTPMLEDYGSQVVAVKWHVWWPSGTPLDPFYRSNPQPSQDRIAYYQISAAPWAVIDGQFQSDVTRELMEQIIDTRLGVASPIAIAATSTRNGMDVDISIDITVESAQIGDARLYVALTEEHGFCSQPENGCHNLETVHHDIHRKLNNNNVHGGTPIDLTTTGAQHFDVALNGNPVTPTTPPINMEEVHVAIWVQNFTTLEVLQAAESVPTEVSGIPASGAPVVTMLTQNNPNPFTTSTAIEYALAKPARVQLRVYDINGSLVRELANGLRGADTHRISWDGRDAAGKETASGIYFYELTGPGIHESRRMVRIQ